MNAPKTLRAGLFAALVLTLLSCAVAQDPLRTVEFYSPAVDRTMKFNVVLPADYENSDERYPVLYLLHGLTSNYTAWNLIGASTYAGFFGDLIVVSPDAGNSWYINYAENEEGQVNNWEDHIIEDVVGYVDANFRTIAQREGRAINGLSMGGYGGLTLGLRHPEMFVSIGSTSGALSYGRSAAARLRRAAEHPEAAPQRTPQRTPEEQAAREERLNSPDTTIGIEGFMSQTERSPKGRPFVTRRAGRCLRSVQAHRGDCPRGPPPHHPGLRHRGRSDRRGEGDGGDPLRKGHPFRLHADGRAT